MGKSKVNIDALRAALDAERSARDLSWRQLAAEIGVTPSLLSRVRNGYKPDADGFATLVTWLGIPAERFMVGEGEASNREPELETEVAALLRARSGFDEADIHYLEEVIHATVRRVKATRRGEA